LHVDALFHSYVRDELLQPWLHDLLQHHWWPHVEQLHALQQHHLDAPSAPSRSHSSLDAWLVHSFPSIVERLHARLHPLLQRLQQLDAALSTDGAPSLHQSARRLLHTLFTVSLAEACSASPSLRRQELMQELLFKYYRINFRIFTRCDRARRAANGAADPEDEDDEEAEDPSTEEPDAAADMDETAATHSVLAAAAALPRVEYTEAALAHFASTCGLLLSLHFLGPSDESTDATGSIPPLLPSAAYLDFFLLRLRKFVRSERISGVADRRVLGSMERWMEHRVRPVLHIILRGREEEAEERRRAHIAATSIAAIPSSSKSNVALSCPSHASFLACYSRLHYHALELFSLARAGEFFDLVKQHPDSLPALQDLAQVLPITRGHGHVVAELSRAFRARVLLPGTETRSIVEQYVNSILSLRTLDPSGLTNLLHNFLSSSNTAQYLRARPDTTRTVVRALWGRTDEQRQQAREEEEQAERELKEAEKEEKKGAEDMEDQAAEADESQSQLPTLLGADAAAEQETEIGLDLSVELEGAEAAKQANLGDDSDAEDEPGGAAGSVPPAGLSAEQAAAQAARVDFASSDRWQPEPVEAGAGSSSAAQILQADTTAQARYLRSADVLSLLIDLCGRGERNEEVLLLEYKNWLSDRFLRKRSTATRVAPSGAASSSPRNVPLSKDALYDTEAEVTHLERMKLRFGDLSPSLQDVEVMLKDITNSKRIMLQTVIAATPMPPPGGNAAHFAATQSKLQQALIDRQTRLRESADEEDQAILSAERSSSRHSLARQQELAAHFSALLLSAEFWPSGNSHFATDAGPSFRMPPVLRAVGDAFASVFHTLKAPRVVEWSSGAGGLPAGQVVEIELSLRDGRTMRVECEPIHAAILELFAEAEEEGGQDTSVAERTRWSLTELAEQLQMDDEEELFPFVQFWLHKGLLRVVPSSEQSGSPPDSSPLFELVESSAHSDEDAAEDGSGAASSADPSALSAKQLGEQHALVETYVLGALNNYSARMSAAQLQQILAKVPGFLYTLTEAELRAVLHGLQMRGTLTLQDGLYTRARGLQAQ
jgi:hypothetical protein